MVSVIIPIYKAEYVINCCVNSVISQTYRDIEIILINDGSPDNCKYICDNYKERDNRIKVIHTKNNGVSKARNLGLDNAHGEYIIFVDADDYLESNAIEMLIKRAKQNDSDLVICGYKIVNKNQTTPISLLKEDTFDQENFLEQMSKNADHIYYGAIWNKLYRTTIIQENRLRFQEGISFAEDFLFNLEVLSNASIISTLDNFLYNYRNGQTDTLSTMTRQVDSYWESPKYLFFQYSETYKKLGCYDKNIQAINFFIITAIKGALSAIMNLYSDMSYKDKKIMVKNICCDKVAIDSANVVVCTDILSKTVVFCVKNGHYRILYFVYFIKSMVYKNTRQIHRIIKALFLNSGN